MMETRRRLSLAAEAFQVRFGRAMAETNDLERHEAVQTLLAGAINDALTAATDFLQEFVIAELCQDRLVLWR